MTQPTPPHDEAATVAPRCGNNPNARLTDGDQKAITEFKAYLADQAAGKAPVPDTLTVNRAQLAALLAHHADVIAARWDAYAPDPAAYSLRVHARELTAEEESPAVAKLLDAVLACPIEPAPTSRVQRVTSHAYEGDGGACRAEAYGQTCGAPRDDHQLDEDTSDAAPQTERELDRATRAFEALMAKHDKTKTECDQLRAALAEVLAIVADWYAAVNDGHGLDAGDLAWRLEQAGHPLPDEEQPAAPAEGSAH
ncbi:hypothetical protein AB0E27_20220 [Streptomyces sparsogenes]|uniref:hypothetical protein n=1 Tax=Streptomyces sparsogenes TaxID=67365 RepID=UPI0033F1B70B